MDKYSISAYAVSRADGERDLATIALSKLGRDELLEVLTAEVLALPTDDLMEIFRQAWKENSKRQTSAWLARERAKFMRENPTA